MHLHMSLSVRSWSVVLIACWTSSQTAHTIAVTFRSQNCSKYSVPQSTSITAVSQIPDARNDHLQKSGYATPHSTRTGRAAYPRRLTRGCSPRLLSRATAAPRRTGEGRGRGDYSQHSHLPTQCLTILTEFSVALGEYINPVTMATWVHVSN